MYVCMYLCIYVCMYVCTYVHTYYVLINPPMPIHYVLAAVFASCFYVLFKIRFVSKGSKRGPFNHELKRFKKILYIIYNNVR